MINLPRGTELIQSLLQTNEHYYLVGGAVRDILLSKTSQDLDIVCTGDTTKIARKLANQVSGSFYLLDEERNACRVIIKLDGGGNAIFDFTQLRGTSLQEDLFERDFTINAMAIDLANPVEIIDPLKGGRDLVEKRLKPCKESSFMDDPLRVIRAIRYCVKYDLKIEPQSIKLLKQAVEKLEFVSKERKRDELFKILDNEKAWTAIELLAHFQVLPHIALLKIPDLNKGISRLKVFSSFKSILLDENQASRKDHFILSSFVLGFKPYHDFLKNHLIKENQSDRSIKSLDALSALIWDVDLLDSIKIVDELVLSKEEQIHLYSILKNRNVLSDWVSANMHLDNRVIFQYYQSLSSQGVDLALVSMADSANCLSAEIDENSWISIIEICQQLFEAWFEHPETVDPKPLLSGNDLISEFDLVQGPKIGELLDGLREEQAAGAVLTREEALDWIKNQLHPRMTAEK